MNYYDYLNLELSLNHHLKQGIANFMSAEKTHAIVLKVIEFSETSCIVTLWTRDFGKITALAKGARRPKSPFEAALDMLAICRIVFLHKSSGAMDLLTEAKLDRRFRSSASSLIRLYSGYYLIELLRNLTEENDPHPDLYELACQTLFEIDDEPRFDCGPRINREGKHDRKVAAESEDVARELNLCLLRFEVRMLKMLGHLPMLTKCVGCGRPRTTQARVNFGLNDGGILCGRCRNGKTNVVSVSPEGVKLLLEIATSEDLILKEGNNRRGQKQIEGLAVREKSHEFIETSRVHNRTEAKEVRQLINRYISHLLGFEPRLYKYLKSL